MATSHHQRPNTGRGGLSGLEDDSPRVLNNKQTRRPSQASSRKWTTPLVVLLLVAIVALLLRGQMRSVPECDCSECAVHGKDGVIVQRIPTRFLSKYNDLYYKLPPTPDLAVDAIIRCPNEGILLVKRKFPPYGYCLPGGFVDYGESLEDAVKREISEETSLKIIKLRQFHAYSDPNRDPRRHAVSVVFIAEVDSCKGREAGDDAASVALFQVDEIPYDQIVFDHKTIVRDYVERLEVASSMLSFSS